MSDNVSEGMEWLEGLMRNIEGGFKSTRTTEHSREFMTIALAKAFKHPAIHPFLMELPAYDLEVVLKLFISAWTLGRECEARYGAGGERPIPKEDQ